MNILVHVWWWLYAPFLFGIRVYGGVELLADRVGMCLVVDITQQFQSGWIDLPSHQQCMRGTSSKN